MAAIDRTFVYELVGSAQSRVTTADNMGCELIQIGGFATALYNASNGFEQDHVLIREFVRRESKFTLQTLQCLSHVPQSLRHEVTPCFLGCGLRGS